MVSQKIINTNGDYKELDSFFKESGCKKIFLVCDPSIKFLMLDNYFEELENNLGIMVLRFSDFQSNPLYESVVKGVSIFNATNCQMIVAVGGGSAMDVAKCIKLYSNMDPSINYLKQTIVPNNIPFLAIPTTAGTGSEATRFAVIYYNGAKQSVNDLSCIPTTVLFDSSAIKTLPEYQRKATMLDALCHSIESYWSVNSTEESKSYSDLAIKTIFVNYKKYLENEEVANSEMLKAAHFAGKAINITQTTAGHAMCYKLTSLYKIAHGHSAALCDVKLFPYMIAHTELCIDKRGADYLNKTFNQIANSMDCKTVEEAGKKLTAFVDSLGLPKLDAKLSDLDELIHSVNPVRLKNNPVKLDEKSIEFLYRQILNFGE